MKRIMEKIIPVLFLTALVICSSCEEAPFNPGLLKTENIDISGIWTISKVYRNEVDISEKMDFSSFSLILDYNEAGEPATYTVAAETPIPFVTNDATGRWTFDNPTYPSQMFLSSGAFTRTSYFSQSLYPVNNSNLYLEFSLGCDNTTYVYHFVNSNTNE
tara:strand:+ start:5943 stop:6422 length:480 start_codon:yes stop_codon:yes gene_type:complete